MAKKRSFKPNWLLIGGGLATAYYVWKSQTAKTVSGIGAMDNFVPNFHIIQVKFIGATNYSGSRIKIISKRFESSKTLSYDYQIGNVMDQAINYLTKKGFKILGKAEFGDSYLIVSDTFENIK